MQSENRRHIGRSPVGNIGVFICIAILGAFVAVPFVYVVNNAFKPIQELFRFPPTLFVQNPTLDNFTNLSNLLSTTSMPFVRYLFNSALLTFVGAAGQIILTSMCAYSLSKIPFPGSRIVFSIIVFSLMFSPVVTQVPNYIIFARLHLTDTYWAMLIPPLASTLGLYLMKQFMETAVPDALMEAARIDGATEITVFFRIVMPLLKPAWMTLTIFCFQGLWNSSSAFTYSETLKTLPQALSQIVVGGIQRSGVSAATSLIIMIVPLTCFIVMQSKIIDTMGSSGMKG